MSDPVSDPLSDPVSDAVSDAVGEDAAARPLLRVVRGDPEPEELAALVAVLAAKTGGHAAAASERRSAWASRSRQVRPLLRPGPDAWRLSTLPR